MEVGIVMTLFERDDVKTGNQPCNVCTKPTRSHVIKPALYEEYIAEVVVDKSDEYANNQWEETEEVTKTRKVDEAVTVCHKCWLARLEEIRQILEKDYGKWESDPSAHVSRIHVVAEICHSYQFEEESKRMASLISMIKETATQ
tara:strand:- start:751 stop:1182 length:432 start_codon:yes stop_codon:yes gene_type:complete